MEYKDYYKVLGVERSAKAEEIKKAYRKLAAKFHPDRHRGDKHFEEKFKEVNEAYDVLGDPEKRKRYDMLGENWKQGQQLNPEDFANIFGGAFGGGRRGAPGERVHSSGGGTTFTFNPGEGGFSDFFETLFGGLGRGGGAGNSTSEGFSGDDPFAHMREGRARGGTFGGRAGRGRAQPVDNHFETSLTISLEEAFRGTMRRLGFQRGEGEGGARQDYDVRIPTGIREGQKIRLKGQGGSSRAGGQSDILISIHLAPHPRYQLEGDDLVMDLPVAAWEAALGSRVTVETLEGPFEVKVPPRHPQRPAHARAWARLAEKRRRTGRFAVACFDYGPLQTDAAGTGIFREIEDRVVF